MSDMKTVMTRKQVPAYDEALTFIELERKALNKLYEIKELVAGLNSDLVDGDLDALIAYKEQMVKDWEKKNEEIETVKKKTIENAEMMKERD